MLCKCYIFILSVGLNSILLSVSGVDPTVIVSELICYNLDCFSFSNVEMPSYFLWFPVEDCNFRRSSLSIDCEKPLEQVASAPPFSTALWAASWSFKGNFGLVYKIYIFIIMYYIKISFSFFFKLKVQNDRDAQSVDKIFTERQA